jgi:hypothetical protein
MKDQHWDTRRRSTLLPIQDISVADSQKAIVVGFNQRMQACHTETLQTAHIGTYALPEKWKRQRILPVMRYMESCESAREGE